MHMSMHDQMFVMAFSPYKLNISYQENMWVISVQTLSRPRGYKIYSMLNSNEHETFPAHKC